MLKTLLFISLVFPTTLFAFVQVNPVRILLSEMTYGHFTVRNTQGKPVKVEITNQFFEQSETGVMKPLNDSPKKIKTILFSPQKFTIDPGAKQVVRFFIKDKLPENEIRTYAHLLTEVMDEEDSSKAKMMVLTPKVALAIPVVLRKKRSETNNVEVLSLNLKPSEGNCEIHTRLKNNFHSSYLNLVASDQKGDPILTINGISNYLNNNSWVNIVEGKDCNQIKKVNITDADSNISVINKTF